MANTSNTGGPNILYPTITSAPKAPAMPKLVVELFADRRFRGLKGTVIDNIPFVGDIGFSGNIASVRIFKGPGFHTSHNYKAVFHEFRDYKGRQIVLGPGYYENLYDVAYDFGGRISSVSFSPIPYMSGPIYGTVPMVVEVYRDPNFQGRKSVILRDLDRTDQIGLDEAISSIRVFRGPDFPPNGCKAIFYEHVEFEGQSMEVALGPLEYYKLLPNLHTQPRYFGGVISSVKLESWVSGNTGRFRDIVFQDEFDNIKPIWQWVDPRGDCVRQIGMPMSGGILRDRKGWLEIHVGPNHDLWWGPNGSGGNMDGPRMVQPASGDFALETRITCLGQQREHGGLLVWESDRRYLRLEKTSALHGYKGDIRFEAHVGRIGTFLGRGQQSSVVNYLRLERTGHEFRAFCSIDGQEWQSCGNATVVMGDTVMVGVHALCPGNIPSTVTRFDYFKILKPGGFVMSNISR